MALRSSYAFLKCCSASILVSDSLIGTLGQLDENVLKKYDLKAVSAYLFEIDIEALLKEIERKETFFEPFSNYPYVIRDISIIVDKKIESVSIHNIIEREGKELIESINVFDLYEG